VTTQLIIDTDPGIDDCLALLLALTSPEIDVHTIVTVYGNTTLDNATRNAHEIVRRAGASVPVVAGSSGPLERPLVTAVETHGESGLGYASVPAPEPVEPDPEALLKVVAALEDPITLVTLGPLTNLAIAIEADPTLMRMRIRRHLAMAGNLAARGNTTPHGEFNTWCDPEAADRVLRAHLGTQWVGLDVTRQLLLTAGEVEQLDRTERERWIRDALRFYVEFHRDFEEFDGCVINDPLLIAQLLRPGTLTFKEVGVRVHLGEGDDRGRIVEEDDGTPTAFATGVRPEHAVELLHSLVFGH
jgi:purine nucleosidase